MVVVQNVPFRAPVTLGDTSGNAKTGVAYSDITVYCQKQGGTPYQKTLSSPDWYELSTVGMPGVYDLQLSSSDLDTYGFLKYSIKTSGSPGFNGILEVQPYDLSGIADRMGLMLGTVGTPLPRGSLSGTVSQDIGDLLSKADRIINDVETTVTTDLTTIGATTANIGAAIGVYNDWTDQTLFGLLNYSTDKIVRALGAFRENSVLDQTTFDSSGNLLSGRMRCYDTKTNALAAKAASPGEYDTGLVAKYSISATYSGANLLTYMISRDTPAESWDTPWPPTPPLA